MVDIEDEVDNITSAIDEVGCNTALTREESVEFYRTVASHCMEGARTIQEEINDDAD